MTFVSVVVAWVFFRADNMPTALSMLSRMADPTQLAFGRAEIADFVLVAIYADRLVRAEYARGHALRSRNRTVGEALGAWSTAPRVPLCIGRGAGFRHSWNPAAQRIHLFQVLMIKPAET